jgi:hypothetical protein
VELLTHASLAPRPLASLAPPTPHAHSQSQMRTTADMYFAPPVGFSADKATLFWAPCYAPSRGMPCVAKRSNDSGVTWAYMDVNSEGGKVFNIASLPPNNKR